MTRVIDDAGDGDYTLFVTGDGDVEARKRIPYDGIRRYTTASHDLPAGRRTQSKYGLSVRDVVQRHVNASSTEMSFGDLIDQVQIELGETEADA